MIRQHLLILTPTPERLRTPGLFSSTRIALLLTGLWPPVMRSQTTVKGSPFPVPVSLQHEWTLTKTRWRLCSHCTHDYFYWRLTSLKAKAAVIPLSSLKWQRYGLHVVTMKILPGNYQNFTLDIASKKVTWIGFLPIWGLLGKWLLAKVLMINEIHHLNF